MHELHSYFRPFRKKYSIIFKNQLSIMLTEQHNAIISKNVKQHLKNKCS